MLGGLFESASDLPTRGISRQFNIPGKFIGHFHLMHNFEASVDLNGHFQTRSRFQSTGNFQYFANFHPTNRFSFFFFQDAPNTVTWKTFGSSIQRDGHVIKSLVMLYQNIRAKLTKMFFQQFLDMNFLKIQKSFQTKNKISLISVCMMRQQMVQPSNKHWTKDGNVPVSTENGAENHF